ncbi:ribokinase [Lysobacteraceae bacterium NML95-0200]|nr:ribokinase [Xanthomonadaceae bacterium NML95-0200]
MQVVVVGSFNLDHVWQTDSLPAPGATLAGRYHSGPGGKGFNQAIAARRAGAETAFVCALGDDAGARLASHLAKADGLQLVAHLSPHTPSGSAGIFVDQQGRNSIVIGAGANAELTPAHLVAQDTLFRLAKVVLAQLETPIATVHKALALGRAAGARTVLNPAPANAESSAELLALADVITPNETEFAALIARHTALQIPAEAVADASDAVLHSHCRTLHPGGSVIITLGSAGCFVSHGENWHDDTRSHYRLPACPSEVVDTTGAGDAFNGAFCAAWAQQPARALAKHLTFASRYAARACEAEGAALAMPQLAPA